MRDEMTDKDRKTIELYIDMAMPVVERAAKMIDKIPVDVAFVALCALQAQIVNAIVETHIKKGLTQKQSEINMLVLAGIGQEVSDKHLKLNVVKNDNTD